MPQQVLHVRTILTSLDPMTDNPSFGTTWEQRGTNTTVDQAYVVAQLTHFLNSAATGATAAMAHYLSPVLGRAGSSIAFEMYDATSKLNGLTPLGSPIAIYHAGLSPVTTGAALPDGVAATISYRVDYGTDVEFAPGTRPRSRDRNRLYLGPLAIGAIDMAPTTSRCIWSAQFITDQLAAFSALSIPSSGPGDTTTLVVWSRRDALVKSPLTEAWVDDRPDYQRRRSDPGIRTYIVL